MESLCSFENLLRLSDGRITMVCHVAKDILGTMVIRCDDCSVTFGRGRVLSIVNGRSASLVFMDSISGTASATPLQRRQAVNPHP